jgi:hypothetical protein
MCFQLLEALSLFQSPSPTKYDYGPDREQSAETSAKDRTTSPTRVNERINGGHIVW